jgi:hypothetical protein
VGGLALEIAIYNLESSQTPNSTQNRDTAVRPLHTSGRSVAEREHHPHMARTRLFRHQGPGEGCEVAVSAVKSWLGPDRDGHADGLEVSTIIVTTTHATMMTEGADDATTTTMTMITAGRRTRGVHEPSVRASRTNIPRYNRDTNPSVWLEDYMLPGAVRPPGPFVPDRPQATQSDRPWDPV